MTEPVVFSRRPFAALALLAVSAALLAACGSGRDEILSEKVAQAELAAAKAEEAQHAAERAARAAGVRLNEINAAQSGEGNVESVPPSDAPSDAQVDAADASAS